MLTLLLLATFASSDPGPPGLDAAQAFYAGRPRVERPQAGWQAVPEELGELSAEVCGFCHSAIYEEWRVSTHAQAWTDRQFQAEIGKSGNRWLCANCHTPLMNQMESWAVGLEGDDVEQPRYVPNPDFDRELRAEGINCAGCHLRDGVIEGPTGIATDAHPTRRAERFLGAEVCLACHQAVRAYPGKDFICVFETGDEWRASPYAASGQTCLDCHMPGVTRQQADGEEPRPGRHHYWPGGGIYKVEGVGPPRDLLGPGLDVKAAATPRSLELTLANSGAGHMLPTGDPERFLRVEVVFFDAGGQPVGELWRWRIGQSWTWWPEPKKTGDNRLKPFEERSASLARPEGAVRWELTASSHRISEEALAYHELEGYPASRVTHRLGGSFPAPSEALRPIRGDARSRP